MKYSERAGENQPLHFKEKSIILGIRLHKSRIQLSAAISMLRETLPGRIASVLRSAYPAIVAVPLYD